MSQLVHAAPDRKTIRSHTPGPGSEAGPAVIVVLDALRSGFPFQLRKHHDDMEHRPPHGGRCIKVLIDADKLHIVRPQDLPQLAKVRHGSGESVQPVDIKLLDLPIFHIG